MGKSTISFSYNFPDEEGGNHEEKRFKYFLC